KIMNHSLLMFKNRLALRLSQNLPGIPAQERMSGRVVAAPESVPQDHKASAVVCLLFEKAGELNLLLIESSKDGSPHSGQIGFPGGRKEEADDDLMDTALRETAEEVGIGLRREHFLGALTPLYIPVSNFLVHPFVAFFEGERRYRLSADEVAG